MANLEVVTSLSKDPFAIFGVFDGKFIVPLCHNVNMSFFVSALRPRGARGIIVGSHCV